jgi:short-subunit dehydrogenase
VTACTDGIGLGFTEVLASNGINIVQVGRNASKLDKISESLQSKYGINVKSILCDFLNCPKDPSSFFLNIFNQCENIEVSILVNNVGNGEKLPFVSSEQFLIHQQNSLNLFCRQVEKNNGFFVNLSSLASLKPSACASVYSAGKAFDKVFSLLCASEFKVPVLCLMPAYVDTPMTEKYKFKPLEISRVQCAQSALKDVGNVSLTCGHWKHWICFAFLALVSEVQVYFEGLVK